MSYLTLPVCRAFMEANPYIVVNAQLAEMQAQYNKLHCHEIVLDSAGVCLRALVWNENFLELRRSIIRKWNTPEEDVHVDPWADPGGWGAASRPVMIRGHDEIDALVKDKHKFLDYCENIIPASDCNSCFMIADVQRSYEERDILVKFKVPESLHATGDHASLLEQVEDYCRALSAHDPSKNIVTIRGSLDHDPAVTRRQNRRKYNRRQRIIEFYKEHGYRLLPWQCCATDGSQGGTMVDAFSKNLSDPALDTDGKLFYA